MRRMLFPPTPEQSAELNTGVLKLGLAQPPVGAQTDTSKLGDPPQWNLLGDIKQTESSASCHQDLPQSFHATVLALRNALAESLALHLQGSEAIVSSLLVV